MSAAPTSLASTAQGPLVGLRVLECGGIGPGPHAVRLLADLGAEVLRVERNREGLVDPSADHGRAVMTLDLQSEGGRTQFLTIAGKVDVLVEGFRPGVMERLGLGPEVVTRRRPDLIYARMTGWGQKGPLAQLAGHDINYLAVTGALSAMGDADRPPPPPLNFVGDYGGGSMFLVTGILAALIERTRSGKGQIIDAAIVDGVSTMMGVVGPSGILSPGQRMVSGDAPFYHCYRCFDGKDIAVGAIEPQFYAAFVKGIDAPHLADRQYDSLLWPERIAAIAAIMAGKTRDAWIDLFEGTDACVAPVLSFEEAAVHPHIQARGNYDGEGKRRIAAPAPRFSRTPGATRPNEAPADLLRRWDLKG
ncbi:MAG TPA: CaiB/BaiF CoA-transferase family protein [Sphingobium sp.]